MGNFNVKHGGIVRASAPVSSSVVSAWTKGRLLTLDTSGNLIVHTGVKSTYSLVGIAMENLVLSTSVGPNVTLTKVGAPTGDRYSYIASEAVVVTDAMESGVAFVPGNLLYCSTNGKVTTSGNSTGPGPGPLIGVALSDAAANDTLRPLTMFFSVTY